MYIYNCIYIYIHITNRWYDMYTANRGYAMDTCIMCIYTICTVYTRLCTYTQYIYTRLHTLQYNNIWVAFLFQCKSASRAVIHMGNLPAASGCIASNAQPSKAPSSLWAQLCSQGFFHGWPRTERWGARLDPQKQTFFSPATKSRFPPANLKIVQKNICSSTCTNQGFTGKTWRGPFQTRGYHKHSQGHSWHLDGQITFPSLNHGFSGVEQIHGGIELQ